MLLTVIAAKPYRARINAVLGYNVDDDGAVMTVQS